MQHAVLENVFFIFFCFFERMLLIKKWSVPSSDIQQIGLFFWKKKRKETSKQIYINAYSHLLFVFKYLVNSSSDIRKKRNMGSNILNLYFFEKNKKKKKQIRELLNKLYLFNQTDLQLSVLHLKFIFWTDLHWGQFSCIIINMGTSMADIKVVIHTLNWVKAKAFPTKYKVLRNFPCNILINEPGRNKNAAFYRIKRTISNYNLNNYYLHVEVEGLAEPDPKGFIRHCSLPIPFSSWSQKVSTWTTG